MKSMRRLVATASTVIALSGMFGAPVAQAGDTKTVMALSCNVLGGAGLAGLVRDTRGRIGNNSLLGDINIFCPLVRDNTGVLPPLAVRVGVIDNSSTLLGNDDISCRLISANQLGTTQLTGGFISTAGTNSAGQQLSLPPLAVFPNGTLGVNCILPRRGAADPVSYVSSIFIDEQP